MEFVLKEETVNPKIVITIYGNKGDGKTALAFSLPGRIACLSFDHKSIQVKKYFYNDDTRIKVFDAIEHLDENPDNVLESSEKTYEYILWILKQFSQLKKKPEWIVIDGLEIYTRIAEMVMRKKNGLKPFQGIVNLNIWKYRRLILRSVHQAAINACEKGLVYTTYSTKDEIIIEGSFEKKIDVPNYIDIIAWQTDIVVHVYTKSGQDKKRFMYYISSSKNDNLIKTGIESDWTNGKLQLNL